MLLGLLGRALLVAAGAAAIAAIVIVIHGMITKDKLRQALKDKNVDDSLVKEINACNNTITLEELNSDKQIEIQGDSISDDINENDIICVY